jgi:hypothetical protein
LWVDFSKIALPFDLTLENLVNEPLRPIVFSTVGCKYLAPYVFLYPGRLPG